MRRPATTALLGGALSVLLLAPLAASPAGADPATGPGAGPSAASVGIPGVGPDVAPGLAAPTAEEALAQVEDLLGGGTTDVQADAEAADVTLALQDLRDAGDELSARDQAAAEAYLARPTDRTGAPYGVRYSVPEAAPTCDTDVCVHRVASSADAASAAYAQRVLGRVADLRATYVSAGYRAPLRDGAAQFNGGNAKTDVYLADIGDKGIYGYCASDDPSSSASTWAYCVLDNDYASRQYPRGTPADNLAVTAAHEYFHAVQFAYDATEDPWFVEGSAVWVEDETFDAVDDNVGYLRHGPMGVPGTSMDLDRQGLEVYGAWSFFRYLTEKFPAEQGGLPTLVRDMWEEADSTSDDGTYSLKAVQRVLAARGTSVRAEFADYAAANRFPAQRYEEGAVNGYPQARLADRRALTRKERTYAATRRLEHLSSATVRLTPGAGLKARKWVLRLRAVTPAPARGSELRVSLVDRDGTATTAPVRLDRKGRASVRRPFSSRDVRAVEVHLVNASTRLRYCGGGGAVSCQGFARDDDLPFRIRAEVRAR